MGGGVVHADVMVWVVVCCCVMWWWWWCSWWCYSVVFFGVGSVDDGVFIVGGVVDDIFIVGGIDVDDNDGILDRRMRLEKESSHLAKMYDTLSGYSLYPKFADSVESLGEVVVALYVIVSY